MIDSTRPDIRAVVSDVDGTLLSSDGAIARADREAVCRVAARGIRVILATGRIPTETVAYYDQLGLDTPLVCYHGALVIGLRRTGDASDLLGAERLADRPLEPATLRELVDFILARHGDAQLMAGTGTRYVINRMGSLAEHWDMSGPSRPVVAPLETAFGESVYKLCYYSPHLDRVSEIMEHVAERFDGAVALQQAHAHLAEFLALGVSKAAGAATALAAVGCAWSECLAIGDYHNDVEMLRRARIGVAMGQAPEAVKAAADWVTADRNHGGVAAALARFL